MAVLPDSIVGLSLNWEYDRDLPFPTSSDRHYKTLSSGAPSLRGDDQLNIYGLPRFHPAAAMRELCCLKRRAHMNRRSLPGSDSISKSPLIICTLSRMLMSPNPWRARAWSLSNPVPQSLTVR